MAPLPRIQHTQLDLSVASSPRGWRIHVECLGNEPTTTLLIEKIVRTVSLVAVLRQHHTPSSHHDTSGIAPTAQKTCGFPCRPLARHR